MNFTLNQNRFENHMIINNQRREEVYILNDSNENYRGLRNEDIINGQKKKRGRKKKNFGNEINNNKVSLNNNNDINNNIVNHNGDPIQIANDEENEEINSII